jgi:hypothetical protein
MSLSSSACCCRAACRSSMIGLLLVETIVAFLVQRKCVGIG